MTPLELRRAIADAGGLCSRAGLAERWGVSRQAVSKMTLKPDFPPPIMVDGKHEVWPAEVADAWRDK
jgi:predicted DNA-binding transcriptional regulator AlpA